MKDTLIQLTHVPAFFDPKKAALDYKPDISAAMHEGIAYGLEHKLKSANELISLGIGHAFMLTDLQNDFRDKGRLAVKGTDDVVLRVCLRLLQGTYVDHYAGVFYSQDGHPIWHMSFDYSYHDKDGKALDLSKHGGAAIMKLVDRKKAIFEVTAFGPSGPYRVGYYQPYFDGADMVEYSDHMEATGQGPIWVFVGHCILGTDGVNLHPLLVETLAFMSGARKMQPNPIFKGHLRKTDWFGPLRPCRPDPNHPQGGFQKAIVDDMKQFKTVDFAGVAEDFCDYNMKLQVMEYLEGTEYMAKLQFITDCTAPIIPNAEHVQKLNAKARAAGVKFITHNAAFAA